MVKSRASRRPFWLIVNQQDGRMAVYTLYSGGGKQVLPIFSFEAEAETFLRLEAPEAGWQARETTSGELISVLCGPCAGVTEVALDPLPVVGGAVVFDLSGQARGDFLRDFVGSVPAPQDRPRPKANTNGALVESADIKDAPLRQPEEGRAHTGNGAVRRGPGKAHGVSPNGAGNGDIPDYVMRDFGHSG